MILTIDKVLQKIGMLHSNSTKTPTDYSLACTLLDNIPIDWRRNDLRILDPACGRGTILLAALDKLLRNDHAPQHAIRMLYGIDNDPIQAKIGMKAMKLASGLDPNIYCDDSLERSWDMQFDVIIGNPPYNETEENSRRPLWPQFTELAEKLLKPDGYLAYVSPPSWIVPKKNKTLDYGFYQRYQIEQAHFFDEAAKRQHFTVGSNISWYVIHKVPRYTTTKVVQHMGSITSTHGMWFDFQRSLPKVFTDHSLSIHHKLISMPQIGWIYNLSFHNQRLRKKKMLSDTRDNQHPYACYFSPVLKRWTTAKFNDFDSWKLMVGVTNTVEKSWIDECCSVTEDVRYIKLDDRQQAQNALSAMHSDLFRYIGNMYRIGRNLGGLDIFPRLDWTKTWTNDDVYAACGLTDEEREYVSYVIG